MKRGLLVSVFLVLVLFLSSFVLAQSFSEAEGATINALLDIGIISWIHSIFIWLSPAFWLFFGVAYQLSFGYMLLIMAWVYFYSLSRGFLFSVLYPRKRLAFWVNLALIIVLAQFQVFFLLARLANNFVFAQTGFWLFVNFAVMILVLFVITEIVGLISSRLRARLLLTRSQHAHAPEKISKKIINASE